MSGRLVGVIALAWLASFSEARSLLAADCRAPFAVGFRTEEVPGGPKMAVWYPTSGKEAAFSYSKDLSGMVSRNGAPAPCRRLPLLVFSHGLGGCGTQSVFFTEQITRLGYIVMAPDHQDASCSVDGTGGGLALKASEVSLLEPQKWTESTHADRRRDIEAVIDYALEKSDWRELIDASKIGGVGHSLGGYTMLGMAGAWSSWKASRLRAILLFSPYAMPFLTQERLARVRVPVMYQGAQFDIAITPFLKGNQGAYALGRSNRYLVELKGGSHFEWTNAICLGKKTVNDCLSTRANAKLIVTYGATFLERFLDRDSKSLGRLKGHGLAMYKKTESSK